MKIKEYRLSRQNRKLFIVWFAALCILLIIWPFIGIGAYKFIMAVVDSYTWQGYELPYVLARTWVLYAPVLGIVYIGVGYAVILYLFAKRPFLYLQEVTDAARKAYQLDDEMIELSAPLKDYEREMNQLKNHLRRSERAAREAEKRKNDLVVYLAHDLKTPLTSVIGYLTLLRDEKEISEDTRQKYLSITLDKAERLEDLINEFFEITRFNLTHITLDKSRVNLSRMLEQIVFEFQPMFAEKNLQCSLSIMPDTIIRCDVDKMERVFDNLLRNAVNYSYEETEIRITAEIKEGKMEMNVTNHGDTIPEDKLNRIFEQFYRLDMSRMTRSGGAGLGLAIAKEIVELHGGHLSASSANDIVNFKLVIPVL